MTEGALSDVLITPGLHFFKELLGLNTSWPLNDLLNQQVFSEMHCLHVAILPLPIPGFFLSLGITLVFFSYLTLQLPDLFITLLYGILAIQQEFVRFLATSFL